MVLRLSEAMEAALSTKYFKIRSYLSRASVYEVRHVIQNIPHKTNSATNHNIENNIWGPFKACKFHQLHKKFCNAIY